MPTVTVCPCWDTQERHLSAMCKRCHLTQARQPTATTAHARACDIRQRLKHSPASKRIHGELNQQEPTMTADAIEAREQAIRQQEHAEDVATAIRELPTLLDAAKDALAVYNAAAELAGYDTLRLTRLA